MLLAFKLHKSTVIYRKRGVAKKKFQASPENCTACIFSSCPRKELHNDTLD